MIQLLYSAEFAPAASMLQWQSVGNVFKLASWPLGFAFAAAARSKVFLFVQLSWNLLFLTMLWIGLPAFGLEVAGTAFLVAYAIHFLILNLIVRRLHGFRWDGLTLRLLSTHILLSFALLGLSFAIPVAGAAASVLLALATGLFGLRIVLHKVGPAGRLATRFAQFYTMICWPLERKND
jgi:PST family polysaccharide transporter